MSFNLRKKIDLESSDIFEAEMFDSFSKKTTLSFEKLKEMIASIRYDHNEIKKYVAIIYFSSIFSTAGYALLINSLGLFNVNDAVSIVFFISIFGFCVAACNTIGNFISKKKLFKFQRIDTDGKKIFELFLHSNRQYIVEELKQSLFEKLENTKIKECNLPVYNFIKQNIMQLEGAFNQLNYEVENSYNRKQYFSTPFETFLNTIEYIEECIDDSKNIKIINT